MTAGAETASYKPRIKWWGFLLVGLVLAVCGGAAIMAPAVSNLAVGLVLGVALVIAGIAKLVQAFEDQEWPGFLWQLLAGSVEVAGGLLVYFSPLKGAAAISLLLAVVFVVLGVSQIGCAFRIRSQPGWGWLLASGVVALAASLLLVLKFPHVRDFDAGVVAGLSLLISGLLYVAIAFAVRRARSIESASR